MPRFKILHIFICFCCLVCGCGTRITNIGSSGENIICFGNSITKGEGSTKGNDYPAILAKKLNMAVINAGSSGDTTIDALQRLEKDVLTKNPRLVIVEFSGNDFLRGLPSQTTFDNLNKIVTQIQEKGAMVVLVEVRVDYLQDEYIQAYRRLAGEKQALLVTNIMKGVLFNPELMSEDQLHPNDKGYDVIADRIYKAIKPLLKQ